MFTFYVFLFKFIVLTKMYCKLFKSMGCSHTVYKYWMQYCCLYAKCFQCLTATMDVDMNAAKLNTSVGSRETFDSNGCSINFCIQSVSSFCNYCDKAKTNTGIYAARLSASVVCRQLFCHSWMQHNSLHPK